MEQASVASAFDEDLIKLEDQSWDDQLEWGGASWTYWIVANFCYSPKSDWCWISGMVFCGLKLRDFNC